MPISIIGPMKMRKFARKRKTTNTIWIQKAELWTRTPAFDRTWWVVPHQVTFLPAGAVKSL